MNPCVRCWASEKVPDDVWRLIFDEMAVNDQTPTSVASIKTVIKLTHVCRRFRRVVVHQPELWNNIPIIIVIDGPRALFLDKDVVVLALKMASQLPLTLSLSVESRSIETGTAVHPGFTGLVTFLQCIHRAKAVSIDHTAIQVCGLYVALINFINAWGAPHLEELFYHGPQSEAVGAIGEIVSAFSKASPKLKTLKIYREQGVYVSWRRLTFNFDRLLHLEIGGPITFQALLSILSSSKSLLTCVIREFWDFEKPDIIFQDNIVISLPFLTELNIRGSRPIPYDTVSQMLSMVLAPSLETLCLSDFDWCPSRMLTFVSTSRFILHRLSFKGVVINASQMVTFLEFFPRLELLAFEFFSSMDDNVAFSQQMMAWDPVARRFQLCPLLQKMVIFYTCTWKDDDPQTSTSTSEAIESATPTPIAEMVQKRLRGPEGELTNLEVLISQSNPCKLLAALNEGFLSEITQLFALKKDGLKIAFEFGCQ